MDSVLMIYGIEYYDDYQEEWRLDDNSFYVKESDCADEVNKLDDLYFEGQMKSYTQSKQYYDERMNEYLNPCVTCGKPKAKPSGREPELPRRKQMYRIAKIILK